MLGTVRFEPGHPHRLEVKLGEGVTPGFPFMVPFSVLWGRLDKWKLGDPLNAGGIACWWQRWFYPWEETFKCYPLLGGYLTPYPGTYEARGVCLALQPSASSQIGQAKPEVS